MHNPDYSDVPLDGEAEDGTQLLGAGRKATGDEREFVFEALREAETYDGMLRDAGIEGVEHWNAELVTIYIFQRALRCRDEILLSRTYTLARKRESYYFKVHYGPNGEDGVWIGSNNQVLQYNVCTTTAKCYALLSVGCTMRGR